MIRKFIFTSLKVEASPRPHSRRCMTAVVLLVLIALVGTARAQSTDRDNPTKLASGEITGTLTNAKFEYYYTFVAGPDEVVITIDATGLGYLSVNPDLFSVDGEKIGSIPSVISHGGDSERAVARVKVDKRQPVILRLRVEEEWKKAGNYRVRLTGDVDFDQGTSKSNTNKSPACLPKQGTLHVKMSDGSIKRVDLSQAQEITIEP